MKTRSKALLLALCALMLVAATVFGTLAYLTDTEDAVNTFTVGHVYLNLDEAKVNPDGTPIEGEDRVQENEYHLLPGHSYTKDPTVTILKDSEESYVRMIVTIDQYAQLTAAIPQDKYSSYYGEDGAFNIGALVEDHDANKWVYEKTDGKGTYEFRYYQTVTTEDAVGKELEPLFAKIVVPTFLTNADIAKLDGLKINVEAHAIQADGFTDADAAWEAFDAQAQKGEANSNPPAAEETP